jgi:hypothetical protein
VRDRSGQSFRAAVELPLSIFVILSEVFVRKADEHAVEGPHTRRELRQTRRGVSTANAYDSVTASIELPFESVMTAEGKGSFDSAAAPFGRCCYAQDDMEVYALCVPPSAVSAAVILVDHCATSSSRKVRSAAWNLTRNSAEYFPEAIDPPRKISTG